MHQDLASQLGFILHEYAFERKLGKINSSGIKIKFSNIQGHSFIPDLIYLARKEFHLQTSVINGAPSLIIEIHARGSPSKDYIKNRKLSEMYGVKEYWVVNAYQTVIDIWPLEEERYRRVLSFYIDDIITSTLKGFEDFICPVKKLFKRASLDPFEEYPSSLSELNS